jgi:hypothetical protein
LEIYKTPQETPRKHPRKTSTKKKHHTVTLENPRRTHTTGTIEPKGLLTFCFYFNTNRYTLVFSYWKEGKNKKYNSQ